MTKSIVIEKEEIIKVFLKIVNKFHGMKYHVDQPTKIVLVINDDDFIKQIRMTGIKYSVIADSDALKQDKSKKESTA